MENSLTDSLSQKPSQQIILQSLSHYFLTPHAKKIPYYSFMFIMPTLQQINSPQKEIKYKECALNCFRFLYSFIRSEYNSALPIQLFTTIILKQTQKQRDSNLVEQILEQEDNNGRKNLLNCYLGVCSLMAETLVKSKINVRQKQRQMVINVIDGVLKKEGVEEEEVILIVNKIALIGEVNEVVKHEKCRKEIIAKLYGRLTQKHKFLISFIKNQLFEQLEQLLTRHAQNGAKEIVKVVDSEDMRGSLAIKVIGCLKKEPYNSLVFNHLLVWWIEGNDQYLLVNQVLFRTNLLVLLLRLLNKKQVAACSTQISMGIQRRMENIVDHRGYKQSIVNLVWHTLVNGLQMQTHISLPPTQQLLIERQSQSSQVQEKQSQVHCTNEEKQKEDKIQNTLKVQQNEENIKAEEEVFDLQPPRNLYDCILGLRNPNRVKITLKYLPSIIRRNPQDLLFSWNELIREVIYSLDEQTQPTLRALFIVRPSNFINTIGDLFFKKETSLNDKIILINCLINGIEQLSSRPVQIEPEETSTDFYFKKVTSKYYKEKSQLPKKQPEKTRRWGHTRIAHEKKLLLNQGLSHNAPVSLKIIDNDPYINRLYEIANHLYFTIISKLTFLIGFPKEKIITRPVLRLLAVLSGHLRNHLQKYKILSEVTEICVLVVDYLESGKKNQRFIKEEKESCMGVIQVLNKISLNIDKNAPIMMLKGLEQSVIKLKKLPEYGIMPLIEMIQGNIYTNYVEKPLF